MKNCATVIPPWRRGILVIAVVSCLLLGTPASGEGDFEYWPKASFLVPINEHWRFLFEEKLTFVDDGARLDDHQMDYCFNYSGLADWLTLGFGFKQRFEKTGDTWEVEDRPLLNVTIRMTLCGWTLSSRSRFEYRIPEDGEESWRYRNKVAVTPPWTLSPLKIQPYVADEVLISSKDEDFNQHRLYGGFFIPLHKKVRLELFYFWKLDEQEDNSWHDTNVVGSTIYFVF